MLSINLQSYFGLQWGKAFFLQNGLFLFLAAFLAVALKFHYSEAQSEDLAWILRPTAGLVEGISGIPFEKEAHTGFVSYARRIVIAPACAGVNFLIVAFCMAAFSGLHRIPQQSFKGLWLAGSMASAYGLTVLVNAVRIMVSIYSYDTDIYAGWFTPERMHRFEGVIIYFFFLCLFYRIITVVIALLRGHRDKPQRNAERPIYRAGRWRGWSPYSGTASSLSRFPCSTARWRRRERALPNTAERLSPAASPSWPSSYLCSGAGKA